ncbi:pentapeptide repeat-containing protein [Streptomyces sp. NPDC005303]|uniref:pentapeptide repeat-containing protein n=1 Tax=Streptomyces sp. NPDC005303 TaxID=3155713 RepID=UPI0033A6AD42
MTSAAPEPSRTPPPWSHCGRDATPENPVGCRGIRVSGYAECLAHLNDADRVAYLAILAPGSDIDHRGTPFTEALLDQLLNALRGPTRSNPHLGAAWFNEASFSGTAPFTRASFSGTARFTGASFSRTARFDSASFANDARFSSTHFSHQARFDSTTFAGTTQFNNASFSSDANFSRASFAGTAGFDRASFSGTAGFDRACFSLGASFDSASFAGSAQFGSASFSDSVGFNHASFDGHAGFRAATFAGIASLHGATFADTAEFTKASFASTAAFDGASFAGTAGFDRASFAGPAEFVGTRFESESHLGPLVCSQQVTLDGAWFGVPVTVEIAAREVRCARTQWASAATLRLRYAELNMSEAVLEYPMTVTARSTPFPGPFGEPLPENGLQGLSDGVRLKSVAGVDAAQLVLHDIDLSICQFAGAIHLDQLRVDGWCTFAETPTGGPWYRRPLRPWSARRTLTEEHHWRTQSARQNRARGWMPPPAGVAVLKPAALAALYRQVRKSLEDGKNEPDAADFYYGEMEMRRHDTTRTASERALLTAYWALSGYGLRALRAMAWLVVAMTATILALMLWGMPAEDPKPTITGRQVAIGQDITLTTETADPVNPTGPWPSRLTTERFEKALRVVINSVVFRSSGQDLTTSGTYTEITSRVAEPILLGFAVLAIRNRVKR